MNIFSEKIKPSRLNISAFLLLCLMVLCCGVHGVDAAESDGVVVDIVAVDPGVQTMLGSQDKLYVKIHYKSDIPLRFQALAMRNGSHLEVGAIRNPGALYASGEGDALAWVLFTNSTHIDSVKVVVFNQTWKEVARVVARADVTWQGSVAEQRREAAEWVKPLVREARRKVDFVYDPSPRKYGLLFDIFFFLNVASLPAYLLLQLHMLHRYRYRWRELAMIPIFPYLIVGFYVLVDIGIERALIIAFLFRYTFAAFLWLAALWLAKRYWQNKLPPPKLYKPPKAD